MAFFMYLWFKCLFGIAVMMSTAFLCTTLSSSIAEDELQHRPGAARPILSPIIEQTINTAGSVMMVNASNDRTGLYSSMVHEGLRDARHHSHRAKMRKIERDEALQKHERDLTAQNNVHESRSKVLLGQHEAEEEHLNAVHRTEIDGLETQRRMALRSLSLSSSSSSD